MFQRHGGHDTNSGLILLRQKTPPFRAGDEWRGLLAVWETAHIPPGLRKFTLAQVASGHDMMVSDWRGVPP
jgi:hypothetical protein